MDLQKVKISFGIGKGTVSSAKNQSTASKPCFAPIFVTHEEASLHVVKFGAVLVTKGSHQISFTSMNLGMKMELVEAYFRRQYRGLYIYPDYNENQIYLAGLDSETVGAMATEIREFTEKLVVRHFDLKGYPAVIRRAIIAKIYNIAQSNAISGNAAKVGCFNSCQFFTSCFDFFSPYVLELCTLSWTPDGPI